MDETNRVMHSRYGDPLAFEGHVAQRGRWSCERGSADIR